MDITPSMPDQYLPQISKMPTMQVFRPVAEQRTFYLGFGVVLLLVWLLTRYREPVAPVAARPPVA